MFSMSKAQKENNNIDIPEEFLIPYSYKDKEPKIYKKWEESGFFNPNNLQDGYSGAFSIIMPPPNANGRLHAGHGLFVALQDLMIRYARMQGKKALWLPGSDHAGFETQVVYEKILEKKGRSRFNLSNDELYKEILNFTLENKKYMENQLRQLGSSCDWSRSTFTLDEKVKKSTYETFKKLDDDGLLYRGLRSVHWCPKHQTAFSELELEYVDRADPFYYFQYGPFVIGTVRPETKFGDKYIVIHPDDKRYSEYKHLQKIEVEWINGPITATIIKDEASNPEIGSGAMTITPWHSSVDWGIAQKHGLSFEQIIDERGRLLPIAGDFSGMNIKDARNSIVEKMKNKGLLVRVDDKYTHSVPGCYKCKRDIEPQLKEQWFIKVNPLTEKAIEAINKKEVQFVSEQHRKVALHWLNNLNDWNISRQIVWGIPIPAKVCGLCRKGMVDLEKNITKCTSCGGDVIEDTDTFDTWFSSGQWPFITLDYPDGEDFKNFYPTDVMETGHDILFFWVLRMLMLGLYRTGKVPFRNVYLHGLVRDEKGAKMSKSKGNVIDPVGLVEEYGADALRMSYIVGNVPGESLSFSVDKIRGYKKFANKLWNIARYVLSETSGKDYNANFTKEDKKLIEESELLLKEITLDMDSYRFHLASEKLYHYIWHTFADVIIEQSKKVFESNKEEEIKSSSRRMLLHIYTSMLKALHPYMPFVTESIWEYIPNCEYKSKDLIMVENWPIKSCKSNKKKNFWNKFFG